MSNTMRNLRNLESAKALARNGWNVFPLRVGTKVPALSKSSGGRGTHDGTTDLTQIVKWWSLNPSYGIGANLGDDRIAFDIDLNHGGQLLESFPPTRVHMSGRGNGNRHLIYKYKPGSMTSRMKPGTNVLGIGIDVRVGRGSYIVMPPTTHEATGDPYWVEDPEAEEHILTDDQLLALFAEAGEEPPRHLQEPATQTAPVVNRKRANLVAVKDTDRTYLDDLLADPPTEGGRNDWLARVAGCLAKKHRNDPKSYALAVRDANNLLSVPLDDAEVEKTLLSIWDSEKTNHPERDATSDTGYLASKNGRLHCVVVNNQGEEAQFTLGEWADFDITAEGVALDDEQRRTYWVHIEWQGESIHTVIPGETLSDPRALTKWLGSYGATINEPYNAAYKMPASTRILRYLNSQKPQTVHVVTQMGYQTSHGTSGFVTADGIITKDGFQSKKNSGVVLDPQLVKSKNVNYSYGFAHDRATAAETLAKVLTYQDETVTAVYGAWWAATFLKPQISQHTSLFPIMGVEAASESGKTTGFFDLMVQMNGNKLGHVVPTKPVMRDYSSANYCGIVWVDDMDDLAPYEELLRASTANGTLSKMDADNTGIKSTHIVAPIFITGEALGMGTQKALADRSVIINAPSPKNRVTADGRPQWEEILELQSQYAKHPDRASSIAGWFVQDALRWETEVIKAIDSNKGKGRSGSKYAILVAGANLLDSMLAGKWVTDGVNTKRVKSWVASQSSLDLEHDNTLTREILPWALRFFDMPTNIEVIENGRMEKIRTPAIIKPSTQVLGGDYEIWYSPTLLSDAWERHKGGRVASRTSTETALSQQSKALGGERKAIRINGTKQAVKMRKLPTEYVGVVMERAGIDVA